MKLQIYIFITAIFLSCNSQTSEDKMAVGTKGSDQKNIEITVPDFDKLNAFNYLITQVNFGPRVPNSNSHMQCLDYLQIELQKYADNVKLQKFTDVAYDNQVLRLTNIIATFNPNAAKRILLCAHWDTHPWATYDVIPENRNKPIPGANDGASGVAVLLEIARIMKTNSPSVGVDIILFDGEDYAKPTDISAYLRGSKYFAKNKSQDYNPIFGILLDMIGDAQLEIPKEGFSMKYAPDIVELVWNEAKKLNIPVFVDKLGIDIIDDHLPLNQAGIKTINLIDFNYPDDSNRYWHTMEDTPDKCSPESLEAVGKLLLHIIYKSY